MGHLIAAGKDGACGGRLDRGTLVCLVDDIDHALDEALTSKQPLAEGAFRVVATLRAVSSPSTIEAIPQRSCAQCIRTIAGLQLVPFASEYASGQFTSRIKLLASA